MTDYKQTRDAAGNVTSQYGQMLRNLDDDLVGRLRSKIFAHTDAAVWMLEAADRIEELEDELNLMKTSGIVEVAVRNPSVMEYMKHWEGRAEKAEAKLAVAARLMEVSVEVAGWELDLDLRDEVIDFVTELKGETQ